MKRYTEGERRRLVLEYEGSPGSATAFCRKRGVSVGSLAEAAARLEKDITLLLVIKENPYIAEKALAAGMKVNENSFHKDEWPAWIQLLKKLTIEQPTK